MRNPIFSIALLSCALNLTAAEPVGVHRQTLGKLEVITLQDGQIELNAGLLKGIEPADAKALLGGKEIASTSINTFLVRTKDQLVLVDTGTGGNGEGPTGHLQERLNSAGIEPSQIDLVLITHFHFDHVGGLVNPDGTRAFPKAIVRVSQAEHDYWLGDPAKLPESIKGRIEGLKKALAPYQAAGTYRPFGPSEEPAKGIRALAAGGHTVGHTVFAFGSGKDEVWCIGDLIHFGAIQFERPSAAVAFDTDSEKAIPARKDFFTRAAKQHVTLAAVHLAFPGLVHLEPKGEGFVATALK